MRAISPSTLASRSASGRGTSRSRPTQRCSTSRTDARTTSASSTPRRCAWCARFRWARGPGASRSGARGTGGSRPPGATIRASARLGIVRAQAADAAVHGRAEEATVRASRAHLNPLPEEIRKVSTLHLVALILAIIGAVNWGLVGLFQFDLVAALFGGQGAAL